MSVKSNLQASVPEFQIPNSNPAVPHLRIRPSRGWSALKLRDVWEYRELLYFLVWRDVKVRYKQTALGVLWVVLQPLATTIVFTLIFGNLAKMPSENLPYAVFALAGLLPWNYFAGAIGRGGSSLVGSANLISKVYFPRLIIPISGVLGGLVDFAITFLLLVALMLFYGYPPTLSWLLLPFFLLMAIATALGVSLWLSALNVQYRDVGYLIPFLVQLWFFATPVVYPSSLVPAPWNLLLALNPMAGVVDGFRWALFGKTAAPGPLILVSIAVVIVTLVSGLFVFKRMERTFADVV
jgi:lipopolysaccharide transport system permease protein